jgi:hypothetical protein
VYAPALTQANYSTPPNYCRAEGIIKNCNTIEDYKNLDRTAILDRCAQTVCATFALVCSSLLIP